MPLYDFKCEKCGHRFETLISWRDKENVKCPECGANVKEEVSSFACSSRSSGSSGGGCGSGGFS